MTVTTDTAPNSTTEGADEAPVPGTWRGVLAPLGVFASSRDRRLLARPGDGVPRTRPLPLPLLYQDALAPGHEGGVPVGVIDHAWIEGDLLMGEGRFDMEDERAADVARKVHQNWLRFVSVDLDDDSHEIGCIGDNRSLVGCDQYAASDDPEELPSHQGIVFSDWRLMGATLVSQPAFPEAFLSSYTSTAEVEGEPLTDTSAITAAAIGNTGLPFADRGRSWDGAGAKKRMIDRAKREDGTLDLSKLAQGFLYRDEKADATLVTSYKFPFADVIDGELKAVFAGVVAAASVLQGGRGGTSVPTAGLKSKIGTLYSRAAKAFNDPEIKPPWTGTAKTAATLVRSSTTPLAVGQFAPDNWKPPAPWFDRPPFSEGTPWTIAGDRVFGHLAQWNVCHIGVEKRCIMAPPSQTGYAYYSTRLLETKGGGIREVGLITMDTGHASLEALPAAATAHYDNTGTMAAVVAVGEDEFGIWCAGSLLPHLTEEERLRIQLSALSGDWRAVRGGMELVAALAVNVPGFPQTRARAGAQGAPFAAVGCGAVGQDAEKREERAERVFAAERTARVQLAANRITRSRIASMTKRMAEIGDAYTRVGESAAAATLAAADGGDNQEGDPDGPYHEELASFLIEALQDPGILDSCTPDEEEAASYASVLQAEEFRRGNGQNWIEKTTTGHLPTFIRRVADHLMAKGMTESHAIATAVNVVKKWCRGGANGNPADGLNWPKTQRVTPKTRAQGCADVAHWEAKRAETRAKSTEDAEALADAGVAS
ncbi:hypothetical protein [Streptomyces violaceusniger]|uniref:Uncharacterized protein n=1 Tax=Streptomyces violaceusniger (strain Tu 4113) TaxID=653045 RepID=G2PHG9_STRV4|nr:hypothetical protein [Streptomyces violaceusniger]AEM88815.1 hypothetical protein Strvi_0038 [Streptomyces violaceusniger Tu 4113]